MAKTKEKKIAKPAASISSTLVESVIVSSSKPVLRDPLLVIGMPGIGFVSKLAVDFLVQRLKAKKFAILYSPFFPNQVISLKNGKLRLFSARFYFFRGKKRDLVFLRGDVQPLTVEGQYEVTGKTLSFFRSLGGKEVIAMAGFAVNEKRDSPKIFATATDKSLFTRLAKLGAVASGQVVPIVGLAGLFPALAKPYSMKGACLLVETPGNIIDAKGAKALADFLSKYVGEKFDTSRLEKRALKTEQMLRQIEEHARAEEQKARGLSTQSQQDALSYIR